MKTHASPFHLLTPQPGAYVGGGVGDQNASLPSRDERALFISVVVEWGAGFSQVTVIRLSLSRPAEWHQRKPAEAEVYAGDIDTLLWTHDGTSVSISTRIG